MICLKKYSNEVYTMWLAVVSVVRSFLTCKFLPIPVFYVLENVSLKKSGRLSSRMLSLHGACRGWCHYDPGVPGPPVIGSWSQRDQNLVQLDQIWVWLFFFFFFFWQDPFTGSMVVLYQLGCFYFCDVCGLGDHRLDPWMHWGLHKGPHRSSLGPRRGHRKLRLCYHRLYVPVTPFISCIPSLKTNVLSPTALLLEAQFPRNKIQAIFFICQFSKEWVLF